MLPGPVPAKTMANSNSVKNAASMILPRQDQKTGLVMLDPVPVIAGDRVRVFDGPFTGVEGILEAHTGQQRALILMDLLGTQSTVEVDSMLLQRVS